MLGSSLLSDMVSFYREINTGATDIIDERRHMVNRQNPASVGGVPYLFGSGSVVQQAFFALQRADGTNILGNFDRAAVFTRAVTQGIVADVDEFARHLDPELSDITRAGAEIIQNTLHFVHALRRVAHLHLAPDDGGLALEDAFLALGEVAYFVVLIHIGDVEGQAGQHHVELLGGEYAGVQR